MSDLLAFLSWWFILQVFGLAALPLVTRLFSRLPDCGYTFAKTAGLLLAAYVLWLGAVSGVLINDRGGILFALLAVAAASAWVALRHGVGNLRARVSVYWREHKSQIITAELLFLLAFAGWALVRAYAPDKIMQFYGEKYMEIAFLNGVLNSPRFPPMDPWLAGYAISYYYFGYVMMGLMAKLSAVPATVSFDLYDALTFALTALTAYGVVSNMVAASASAKRSVIGFGLLGALFVVGLGNLEGLLEALYSAELLPEAFWSWIAIPDLQGAAQNGAPYPGDSWWWWRASRVLQDINLNGQPISNSPIDEFPFFSFLLGDNHPHKMALPFVLLAVGLAFNLILRASARSARQIPEGLTGVQRAAAWLWLRREEYGLYLFAALVLGGLAFLNTWDFPIYFGLFVLADIMGRWRAGEPVYALLKRGMFTALALSVASILLYIFFFLSFSSQAGGILPYIFPPTRLAQYLVMFGPFIFVLVVFLAVTARQSAGDRFPWERAARTWLWIAGGLLGLYLLLMLAASAYLMISGENANPDLLNFLGNEPVQSIVSKSLLWRLGNPWLFLLLTGMLAMAVTAAFHAHTREEGEPDYPALPPSVLLALLMAFTGIALTLSVEFVYLRDVFAVRMNTIFKFYYQAWVLMALAAAFGAWWVLRSLRLTGSAIFASGLALLTVAGLVYPMMGIRARTEGFRNTPSLDAAGTVSGLYPSPWNVTIPDDWAAIEWMRENVLAKSAPGDYPVILEATNGSYQVSGRVSAFTGLPALLGWPGHQHQWRGTYEEISPREADIRVIYTTPDDAYALELLRKWNIRYVIVGEPEREYINRICSNPNDPCSPDRALAKFDRKLTPVFNQGSITVYRVP